MCRFVCCCLLSCFHSHYNRAQTSHIEIVETTMVGSLGFFLHFSSLVMTLKVRENARVYLFHVDPIFRSRVRGLIDGSHPICNDLVIIWFFFFFFVIYLKLATAKESTPIAI